MGEVWRSTDLELGRAVAVKRVRSELLADPALARLFRAEIAAVARLSHPGIVPVYDLVQDDDGGQLLVMAYRGGGSLAHALGRGLAFGVIRSVLRQLLAALAYAHARQILHLDIKPENVLVERRSDGALEATLVDFGIARVRRPGRGIEKWFERGVVIGTVEYMAPEQCAGAVEQFGPWTDLYALGAMAYELCSGQRPFRDADLAEALAERMTVPAPPLVSRLSDVPPGFGELCSWLLATTPRDRPACAADVLDVLDELPHALEPSLLAAGSTAPPPGPTARELAPTAKSDEVEMRTPEALADVGSLRTGPELIRSTGPVSLRRGTRTSSGHGQEDPSLVRRTHVVEEAFTADPLPPPAGAYGLFGLRDLPVLGRPEERRAIWSAVKTAVLERRPVVTVLRGPAGVGKSRLARDAAERAEELGLCTAMQTWWASDGSGDDGVRGLCENVLDSRGALPDEVRARLDFWLARFPGNHAALRYEVLLLLRPPPDAAPDAGLPVRVLVDLVSLAASQRPVLLWLDDVQWSRGEASSLVEGIVAHEPPLAVCVLATVRDEDLDVTSVKAARLPHAHEIAMMPLELEASQMLVRGLLEVDDELCELCAARSEGNPLFMTEMLKELVRADAIERRDGCYRLTRTFDLKAVPADIGALWERRIARSGAPRDMLKALAIVRARVSLEVADELVAALGPSMRDALDAATYAGLLHVEDGAYAWTHGLLRDWLVRSLEPSEAPALHAAAARALAPLAGREDVQEERARHLAAAGAAREACEAMLDAGLWSFRRADQHARAARFDALASWARDAGFADLEARALAERAYLDAEQGRADAAESGLLAARARLDGTRHAEAAWVAIRASQALRIIGKTDAGRAATEEALVLATRAAETSVLVIGLVQRAIDLQRAGDKLGSRPFLEEARTVARVAGDRLGEARALQVLAYLREPAEAAAEVERAASLAREVGALRVEIVCRQSWVDFLYKAGERAMARVEAATLLKEAGRVGLRQTVALLHLQCGIWSFVEADYDETRRHAEGAARWGAMSGAVAERVCSRALAVALAIVEADTAAAASLLDELERERGGYSDDTLDDLLRSARAVAPLELQRRLR
jgi:serine/threonine protein kinase